MRENPERKGVGNSILNGDGVFEEPNEVKSDELYIILCLFLAKSLLVARGFSGQGKDG